MPPSPALIEALRARLSPDDGLVAAYLFGSVARGQARPDSDVDLGLLYREAPEKTLRGQPFLLEAALGQLVKRPVQLVVMNTAPPDLVHRVLADGILLFDNDPSRRIAFEVQARNAYFDLLPVLREYRRARAAS